MSKPIILAVATAVLLASRVRAEESPPRAAAEPLDPAPVFDRLDANQDGQVAAGEVSEEKERLFRRLLRTADTNGDGQLSREEFVEGLKNHRPDRPFGAGEGPREGREPLARFKQMDANGDGKVALDEVPEQARPIFERLLDEFDEDGDDTLSPEEFRKGIPLLMQYFAARRDADARGPGRGGNGPPLLKALDANGNGTLEPDEIAAAPAALKKLDRNGDGSLTADEIGPPPGFSPGEGPRPFSIAGGGPNLDTLVSRLLAADKNGDGKLSSDEAPERLKKNFTKIDTNGDGALDAAELHARFAAMQARFGGKPGERFERARNKGEFKNPARRTSDSESSQKSDEALPSSGKL